MHGQVHDGVGNMTGPGGALELQEEWDARLRSADPLEFPGYKAEAAALESESVRTGRARSAVVIESRFEVFGGSMGVVAGEKVTRAIDRAIDLRLPVAFLTRSGGARMQEGMVSLLQLGRCAAAMNRHAAAGLLSVAVFRSPTTGGVFASYASLCDLRAAEAGAIVGFAGPRVVEQLSGQSVAGRSHSAETAFEHGLIDAVLAPDEVPAWVEAALGHRAVPLICRRLPAAPDLLIEAADDEQPAWAEVLRARGITRPTGLDHAVALTTSWTELHGVDPTVRCGLATMAGQRVMVVASDRHAGRGRPGVAGFRLAQRAIALAGRLGLPLVSLVDTPGANASSESENEGIAGEIARTFAAMAALPTPSVAVCVGEGGSGGALALAWSDRLLIQEHAIFSVIAPEGAAAILERDAAKAPEVAERLALTSTDLLKLGVVDAVVPESAQGVRLAVEAALVDAVVGDRERRADAASVRWLTD